MDQARAIGKKWHEFTRNTNGNFIRYIDGNPNNAVPENMQEVTAFEAMQNIEWVVDWTMPLTPAEIGFVRANNEIFAHLVRDTCKK